MSDRKWWAPRVVHEFKLPASLHDDAGARTVGMVELTTDEEFMALESGRNQLDIAYQMTRLSVATIDGQPVPEQNGELVQRLFACSPKVRSLLNAARLKLSEPEQDEIKAFLAGAQQIAG